MYVKSILELEKAYQSEEDFFGLCDVECVTHGIINDDEYVVINYVVKSSITLPREVVNEFIVTKCHSNISAQTIFETKDLSQKEVKDIFRKVHQSYCELILCRANFIQREFIELSKTPELSTSPLLLCPTPCSTPTVELDREESSIAHYNLFSEDEEEIIAPNKDINRKTMPRNHLTT